jgi:Phage integrase, N-terminal SAM-like domain
MINSNLPIVSSPAPGLLPARLFAPTPKAALRVLEFFTAQINNEHTRKAYLNAARRFAEWCDDHDLSELADVQPFHVAAFIKELQREFSAPTVKQHLAALRMLFDWLVTGHVLKPGPRCARPTLCGDERQDAGTRRRRSARPAGLHPDRLADRSARPRADRRHGLHLRAALLHGSAAGRSQPSASTFM